MRQLHAEQAAAQDSIWRDREYVSAVCRADMLGTVSKLAAKIILKVE
jgi:hypothetical protein